MSDAPTPAAPAAVTPTRSSGAFFVSAGILASRLSGLVRNKVIAHYLGSSIGGAAFITAQQIPNLLQNLLGEGVLSASFIPVYARLLREGKKEEADRLAGAVFGLLALGVGLLSALGVYFAPEIVRLLRPDFGPEALALSIRAVRITFPGLGVLVLSAWCLGILNSHRKFFLSYAAPVMSSVAIIAALVAFGGRVDVDALVIYGAYGVVAGAVLQFGVQLPNVLRLIDRFRPSISFSGATRAVGMAFVPVVIGRGVIQISAFVDQIFASTISERVYANLGYAQIIYVLPVSLFGIAIAAAELPAMSQVDGSEHERFAQLRERLEAGLQQMAFFVIPSSVALFFIGDVVAAVLLQGGKFTASDARYVWLLLIGSSVGLLGATMARLYASTFYAMKNTRTPLYFAAVRVAIGSGLAYLGALWLPRRFGWPEEVGGFGITAATSVVAWIELALLRRALSRRVGPTRLPMSRAARLWGAALGSAAIALAVKVGFVATLGVNPAASLGWGMNWLLAPRGHPVIIGACVIGAYGVAYFALTHLLGVPQARALIQRLRRAP